LEKCHRGGRELAWVSGWNEGSVTLRLFESVSQAAPTVDRSGCRQPEPATHVRFSVPIAA
jgi:hypothetical protein